MCIRTHSGLCGSASCLMLFMAARGADQTLPGFAGDAAAVAAAGTGKAAHKAGLKAVLDSIGSLWDEQQYAEDLSLDAFMAKLK